MVLTQGSLDGPFLCPLKSCNFRVLVQNSPPFLQDCTIGGKLLGDYQQFKICTNFIYFKEPVLVFTENQPKGTTAPSETPRREPIWRSWSRVEGCKPLLNLLKLLVVGLLPILYSLNYLVGKIFSYQLVHVIPALQTSETVQGWMVEKLQLTASSVPTLGQLELQDQPIILGAKFRLPQKTLNSHQITQV